MLKISFEVSNGDSIPTVEIRLAGIINSTPTPRLIIPTGNHYLARLTVPLENYKDAKDFEYVSKLRGLCS